MAVLVLMCQVGSAIVALPLARGQDARHVTEPRIPPICAVLDARLSAADGVLSEAAEEMPDTDRIQKALDGCGAGKAVELRATRDKQVFLAGPLRLGPGVTLLIAARTALFASRDQRDYDVTPGSCGVVTESRTKCRPFILAERAPGAGIMGDGLIDGRGGAPLLDRAARSANGGSIGHEQPGGRDAQGGEERQRERNRGGVTWWDLATEAKVKDQFQACPALVVVRASDNFILYRITLRNAANLHVLAAETNGFTAWGVKIKTPKTARNTDGINPQSSTNVTITHCFIDTGDDNVAIKAGAKGPVSHVTIAHNHFYAGHGMSIGSETSGGVNLVKVIDLSMDGTDHGIRIKSDRSRGGLVQDVSYDKVCLRNVGNPILLDTRYTAFPGDKVPVYRGITLKDVHAVTSGGLAILGLDEKNRVEITLDNVTVTDPGHDLRAEHAAITIGPRRGNFIPAGSDVSVKDSATKSAAPVDCRKLFVPFPDISGAPTAAIKVPPEDRTLYVAASGSGDYYSIQRAVNMAPATGAVVSIGPGTYRERVVVAKPHIVLRSPHADASKTVIVYDRSSGSTGSTFTTATVEVTAADFRAENLTFFNDFNRTHVQQQKGSQALALMVSGDRAIFRNLRLIGDQDTLYAGSADCSPPGHEARRCTPTRQYFEDCFIEGNVDFIFGNSLAVFDRCEIRSNRHVIGYLTAQGRQDKDEKSLFVFNHCRLTADPGVSHVWLGRPWRPWASVVFLNTEMGAHIEPAGWREWHTGETHYMESVFYAEYNSTGPGAHPQAREAHTKKLSAAEAAAYETSRVLGGDDHFDPAAVK